MKSVGDFWFRIGLGAALLLLGLLVSLIGPNGAGLIFVILGLAQIAWTAVSAQRTIRKAERIQSSR